MPCLSVILRPARIRRPVRRYASGGTLWHNHDNQVRCSWCHSRRRKYWESICIFSVKSRSPLGSRLQPPTPPTTSEYPPDAIDVYENNEPAKGTVWHLRRRPHHTTLEGSNATMSTTAHLPLALDRHLIRMVSGQREAGNSGATCVSNYELPTYRHRHLSVPTTPLNA